MPSELLCIDCVRGLTRFQTGLLDEPDSDVVAEHLSECANCRLFANQLEATSDLLGVIGEAAPLPESFADVIDQLGVTPGETIPDEAVRRLCAVADAVAPADAAELVQQTLTDALDRSPKFDVGELVHDLLSRVTATGGEDRVDSLYRVEDRSDAIDPDADGAELYYPEFYSEGVDAGRVVDAPEAWGREPILRPDDDVLAGELFGLVDSGLDALGPSASLIVQLVEFDGLDLSSAAAALGLEPDAAADLLHSSRVHLRGVVGDYFR